MATGVLSNDDFYTNTDDQHLELFCLIWLDANANVTETRNTEQKLRSIINHLKKFQDIKQCQQYIDQRSQKERLVIIVNGQMGREIVPSIHKLRQVISIYVYCMDTKRNEEWASKFAKVKAVVITLDELISRIGTDHRIRKKVEEPLSINMFTTNTSTDKSTTGVNGEFVFSQVLIDCLLRLKSTQTDRNELIDYCKNEYEGNQSELNNLHKFEEDYSPDKALWWYTRETFFYRILNGALRTQNIHMIFLLRAFIADICRQLQDDQAKNPLRAYRSQLMSSDELDSLKQYIGQFISINSFFSTSDQRRIALFYLGDKSSLVDSERVLFEIDADPKIVTTKSFANITQHSDFPDESEVLFMLGSIFRLQSIKRNNDDEVWMIWMTLCSDDAHEFKPILMHMKQQIGSEDTNLRTLANLLWEMGQPNLAEKYFIRLLKQLLPDDPLHISLYEDLGKLASQRHDFDMSVKWRQKSLVFKKQNQPSINPNIIKTVNSTEQQIFPSPSQINSTRKWKQQGITIAGGNFHGDGLHQLSFPEGLYVSEDDQKIYIADWMNHRIVTWKDEAKKGEVVVGGNGTQQLCRPSAVIIDPKSDSLIICDHGNRRVMRWSRRNEKEGQTLISDIACWGLTMDHHGDLYVSDYAKDEVRRWKRGETDGTIVAGGHGQGNQHQQLHGPTYLCVDAAQSVYVSDEQNHRVMTWVKGAKEGIVVAGGRGRGDRLTQLSNPRGVVVDRWGDLYVADWRNHRIMRWSPGAKEGSIVLGRDDRGNQPNQFSYPTGLSFDDQGHLYVADCGNHRVQKFLLADS